METQTQISNFESEMKSQIKLLQSPSSSIPIVFGTIVNLQSFLTCTAVLLAFLFMYSRLSTRIINLKKGTTVIPTPIQDYSDESESDEEESEYEDEDESDSEYSYVSSEEECECEIEKHTRYGRDFTVAGGSDKLKMSLSWSDFVTGRNVVKSWDGFGVGFEKASESLISLWDSNKLEFNNSFNSAAKYQIPALSMPSPSVIVSAGLATGKNVALRVFDTRLRRQIPQIFAEWQPCRKRVGGDLAHSGEVNGEVEMVVRDLRKLDGAPLEELTESDVMSTWWGNGEVVVDGNREISCLGSDNGSVVLRCRNAVFSSLL